jgi:hypothetical protein
MTIQAFEIEATMELKSAIPDTVRKLIEQFDQFNTAIEESGAKAEAFIKNFEKLSEMASQMARLATAAKRVGDNSEKSAEKFKSSQDAMISASTAMADGVDKSADKVVEAAKRAAEGWKQAADDTRSMRFGPGGGGAGSGKSGHGPDMMDIGMRAGIVGAAILEPAKGMAERSLDWQKEVTKLQFTNGYSDDMISNVQEKAMEISKATNVPPVEVLKIYADNKAIMGDMQKNSDGTFKANDADLMSVLPQMATGFQALHAIGINNGASEDAIQNVFQALDLMGHLYDEKGHKDVPGFTDYMYRMIQTAVQTNFRASPEQYKAMAKTGGFASMTGDKHFIYGELPYLLSAEGGARIGTEEMATYAELQHGTMTKTMYAHLQSVGLLDKKAVWDHNHVPDMEKHLPKGTFKELQDDPIRFVHDVMLPLAKSYVQKHNPGKKFTEEELIRAAAKELADEASRQTGQRFFVHSDLMYDAIQREGLNIDAGKSPAQDMAIYNKSVPGKIDGLESAYDRLAITLGNNLMKDAVKVLDLLTSALNKMADWAAKNPETAKRVEEVVVGLGLLSTAIAGVSMALWGAGGFVTLAGLAAKGGGKVLGAPGVAIETVADGLIGQKIAQALPWGARLASRAALPLAAGYAVHELDANDNSGYYMDKYVPGAGWLDDFAYRKTGGAVGHPLGWTDAVPTSNGAPGTPGGSTPSGPVPVKVSDTLLVKVVNAGEVGAAAGNAAANGTVSRLTNALSAPPTGASAPSDRSVPTYPGTPMPAH